MINLDRKKDKFTHICYSSKKNKIILLRYVQCVLIRKGKPDHYYFEYADEELFGKYIPNKRLIADEYEFIDTL